MKITKTFTARDRAEWRAWLEKNHATEAGTWLVFFKGEKAKAGVPYEDAVEEALCFGWIDSVIQKIDEYKYVRKFSPRKDGSKWSALNKSRVEKLIQEGRMTEAGRAKLWYSTLEDDYGRTAQQRKRDLVVPPYFKQALMRRPKAWENFTNLAPSYRRIYLLWIKDARTEETRAKRLAEATKLLAENKKLGMR